jgi:DNA recombination protein RmuC
MVAVLAGVVGLVVGGVIAWSLAQRRTLSQRDDLAQVRSDVALRDLEIANLKANAELVRQDSEQRLAAMTETFENIANRSLQANTEQLKLTQAEETKNREATLDRTLKPLADLLNEYQRSLNEFGKEHVDALSDVKHRAEELLVEQRRSQDETRRLNQLLGRNDQRGRWGEIQLANVLESSGLVEHIDYELQVSATSDAGRTQRPDCVVKMPNGSSVAVDAKFPFGDFEAALSADSVEERKGFELKHAKSLRAHVKTLGDKAYWESVAPAPEFVVCFVPSDVAVSAAFEADPELMTYAARQRVLIVGPTNLLSLLWSVAMVVRQQKLALNAEKIYEVAETIFDRIRLVAEPVQRMGRAIETQVKEYNAMVSSFETRLIVSARGLQRLGGAAHAKPLPELGPLERFASRPDFEKWGIDDAHPLPEGTSDILDIGDVDE